MPFTVTDIVDQANARTEKKAEGQIDLRRQFFVALDSFIGSQHYWWRIKNGSFETVIGEQDYDLSAAYPDLQEIKDIYPNMVAQVNSPRCQGNPLVPMLDDRQILSARQNTQNAPPAGYFIDPSLGLQTVSLNAPADQVTTLPFLYYAMAMVTDPTVDAIPLVPGGLHWGLVDELEVKIYEVLIAQDDPRYAMASANRAAFRAQASLFKSWSSRSTMEMRSNARAVRSS